MKLEQLPGLGPKSAAQLREAGIDSEERLRELGAVRAYLQLKRASAVMPSLNFLYAMEGAITGRDWKEVAKSEKARLLPSWRGWRSWSGIWARGLPLTGFLSGLLDLLVCQAITGLFASHEATENLLPGFLWMFQAQYMADFMSQCSP